MRRQSLNLPAPKGVPSALFYGAVQSPGFIFVATEALVQPAFCVQGSATFKVSGGVPTVAPTNELVSELGIPSYHAYLCYA